MIKFVVLCSFLIAGSIAYPTRIVNGTDAKLGEIPYIVSLQMYGSHNCGGSILDATHVLTAAHCVQGYEGYDMNIQYGIIDLKDSKNKIEVIRKKYHENYTPGGGYENDVAVLTLAEPIVFSENAQPTVLPEQGEPTPGNSPSILAGWGYERTGGSVQQILQRVDLKVYTDEDCESKNSPNTNRDAHVCSGVDEGGKGQCSGDSGGPLYSGGKQVGVVSWSYKPCTIQGHPGVFAKVSSYVDWIHEQMQD